VSAGEPPIDSCTGGYDCPATLHIHGCFSDDPCQHPEERIGPPFEAHRAWVEAIARGAGMSPDRVQQILDWYDPPEDDDHAE
jgi:hypothetical protein